MNSHSASFLQAAQRAMQSGQKQQARELLQQAIRQNPHDYRAWLWLGGLTTSPRASLAYIAQAEKLKPGDPQIQQARRWAEGRLGKDEGRTTKDERRTTKDERRTTNDERRTTNDGRRTTNDEQETRRDAQRATHDAPSSTRGWLLAGVTAVMLALMLTAGALFWLYSNGPVQAAGADGSLTLFAADSAGVTGIGAADQSEVEEAALGLATATAVPPTQTATAVPSATPPPTNTPRSLEPKQVLFSGQSEVVAPRATWTPTPLPTATPSPTPTFAPTALSSAAQAHVSRPAGVGLNERWIDVNLTTQTLTAYEGNTAVRSTLISSGLPRTPTVTGQFRIYLRYRSQDMNGYRLGFNYYLRDVPYVQYFYGNYGLHGTYWHNNFGTPMSHGCVNLPTPEAEWLFNWAGIGTLVYVHY